MFLKGKERGRALSFSVEAVPFLTISTAAVMECMAPLIPIQAQSVIQIKVADWTH